MVLWRPASTRNSRFVLWACRESLTVGYRTLWAVYKYLRWCLDVLFDGYKPMAGYLGESLPSNLRRTSPESLEPLCQGVKFALTELRGDWSWHCHSLQLRPRWNSNKCCFKCLADGAQRLDYSLTADWLDTQVSHEAFMRSMLKHREPCPLVTIIANATSHLACSDLHVFNIVHSNPTHTSPIQIEALCFWLRDSIAK